MAEGGIRTPVGGFSPPNGLVSKRVIALWLAGKLLKTKDAVRLTLDGLGWQAIGINWDKGYWTAR